jgi:PST family polysaccharide transporter
MLQRDLRFARRASVEIAQGVARAVISIGLAVAGFGVWALVGGLLAGEALGTALSWWAVGAWPRLSLDRQIARALMGFGLTFIALKIVDAISIDSDYLIVGHRLGATQLGYYSIAYRLPELALTSLYWMVGAVSFPIYARARARGYKAPILASLRALRLITLFSFPAGVLLALLSRDVIYVVFSSKWAPAIWPMVLISLMTAITSIGYAFGDLFPATGRPGTLLVLNAPLTVVLVIGFIVVVPYGIVAVAIVHLVIAVFSIMARLLLVSKLFGMRLVDQLGAMWPGTCAVIGVLVLAGPLRLLMAHGPITLIVLLLAGLLGAAGGLLAGSRGTIAELRQLAMSIRPTAGA